MAKSHKDIDEVGPWSEIKLDLYSFKPQITIGSTFWQDHTISPYSMQTKRTILLGSFVVLFAFISSYASFAQKTAGLSAAKSQTISSEQRTTQYLDSIRKDPLLLRDFLYKFPKGGDLHNHLSGAVYAEDYIQWAAESGFCVNTQTFAFVAAKSQSAPTAEQNASACDDPRSQRPAADALRDPVLYRNLIDALSMRNHSSAGKADEYQFFDAFPKFGLVSRARTGEMLAEVAHRAVLENEHYLELTVSVDAGVAFEVADRTRWLGDDHLAEYREKLLQNGLRDAVAKGKARLDDAESVMRAKLGCNSANPDVGCAATTRYIGEVARAFNRERVFAQMLACFEVAQADIRVVAVNLVQPEDWLVPVRDYDLHMRMLDYLHGQYPKVSITLHAGELSFGQVMPDVLGTHIPKAIDMGHAQRIGHGVDVMYYPNAADLLSEMAQKHIAVEIALTSNDEILGVRGADHPFLRYMKAGVPLVIATDDEGVARSDVTHEYQRAVETYALTYADLKRLSRNSLEYSFLPGTSLWAAGNSYAAAPPCAAHASQSTTQKQQESVGCAQLLKSSDKAREQWRLEQEFVVFEREHSAAH